MKQFFFLLFLLYALLAAGCVHNPGSVSSMGPPAPPHRAGPVMAVSTPEDIDRESPAISRKTNGKSAIGEKDLSSKGSREDDRGNLDTSGGEEVEGEETASIADPLEPFNRAMYHFNDKLYFWVMKPVAQAYSKVVPEGGRSSVKNFFTNLGFPMRFVNCLLQADFGGAATELGRFAVNTLWGIGGLLDPAAGKELDLQKQDRDLGQTLGVYGLGQGFYIVWPVIGPSSLRDSAQIAGEYFLYPVSYISPWYDWFAVRGYQEINDTSLRIGDYEALKEAAIDPYVAIRNAYIQYRQQKVKEKRKKEAPVPGGVRIGAAEKDLR